MRFPRLFWLVVFFAALLGGVWAMPALAQEAGRVVSLTPGVFVERSGKTLPLELKGVVEAGDTLVTDASGRVRILFSDDSSLSIGPDTTLELREYLPDGSKPSFKAHLGKGLMRAITGKIVEMNPAGFALTSPEATVGIRGTIISMRSDKGVTTVFVESTTRNVFVNNVNVPAGQKITVPADRATPQPILPQDRREIGRSLAFRGGSGTAAAAPEPVQTTQTADGRAPLQSKTAYLVADGGLPAPETALASLPLSTQLSGDSLSGGGSGALVSGVLLSSSPAFGGNQAGTFSFSVDLGTGAISGGTMTGLILPTGTPGFDSYSVSGGTGTVYGTSMSLSGFSGTAYSSSLPHTIYSTDFTNLSVTGSISNIGDSVYGSYNISAATWPNLDSGNASGSRTR